LIQTLKVHILSYYSLLHQYKVQGLGVTSSIDSNEKTSIRLKVKIVLEVEAITMYIIVVLDFGKGL